MKQPSTIKVGEVLRLTKNFFSPLNNKNPKDWNTEDYNEWRGILGLDPLPVLSPVLEETIVTRPKVYKKKKHENSGKPKVKVIRISDGKTYNSISECMKQENIYKVLMRSYLDEGIKYKKA